MIASTIQQVASVLDGADDRTPASKDVGELLARLGFVVVFGLSDDLIEIRGASDVEIDAWQGRFRDGDRQDLRFLRTGLVADHTPDKDDDAEMVAWATPPAGATQVDVAFGLDVLTWSFSTDAPHASFTTNLHGTPFCRGLVIDLASLPA